VAGLDVGTSGVKATVVEVDGNLATERVSTSVAYRPDGEPSRDPERWLTASLDALSKLTAGDGGGIEGIGFTGQMHALVLLGAEGGPLRPALLWLDYEGDELLQGFVRAHPDLDLVRRTGNVALADFTLAKWLYAVASAPGLVGEVRAVVGAKDYVRARLCGGERLTDVNEAAGMQWYDPFERRWATDIVVAAGLSTSVLPTVVSSRTFVAAAHGGDVARIAPRSVVGTGDQAAASRAVGALNEGVASLSLGTSGVVACRFDFGELPENWDGRFHLFPLDEPGEFQLIGTVPSVGPTLRWLSRLTRVPADELAALAGSAAANRSGVHFFPYLGGRGAPNADAQQRGALVGLTEQSSPADVAHAVYLGIAFEISSIVSDMRAVGAKISRVVCSGGAALDRYLVETIAACLDVPCLTASGSNASASGAALFAYDAITPGTAASLSLRPVPVQQELEVSRDWCEQREALVLSGRVGAGVTGSLGEAS
jgi:sugar (pentulose or hexulose) kinase